MSWEHWPQAWQHYDLTAYRDGCLLGTQAHQWLAAALRSRTPLSLCSLGDSDVAVWTYDELIRIPGVQQSWLDQLVYMTGIAHPTDRLLWPLMDAAYRQTSAWLIQCQWDIAARLSYCCMELRGVQILPGEFLYHGQPKQKIDCEAVYTFAQSGELLSAIADRRIAIVSGISQELSASFTQLGLNVAVSCPFPRSVHQRKLGTVEPILQELLSQDWDLLLCSAGGLSPVFCHFASQLGRQAFDIGSADALLTTGTRFL